MNYLKIKGILLAIIFLLLNCSVADEKVSALERLSQNYNKRKSNSAIRQAYILTAFEGCGACVSYTINFIQENIKNKQMMFVISGRSKKLLNIKFSKNVINSDNFIFDNEQIALKEKIIDIVHPKVYLVENRRLVNYYDIDFNKADSLFKITRQFVE